MNENNGHSNGQESTPPLSLVTGGPLAVDLAIHETNDGTKVIVFRLEHSTGTFCQPLMPDFAEQIGNALVERADEARTQHSQLKLVESKLIVPS